METKTVQHTPGPWSRPISNEVKTESGRLIAHCFPENGTREQLDECFANARLFAAAPELMTACEAFVVAWEKSLQLEKTDVALRLAKDAIAKAEGKPEC